MGSRSFSSSQFAEKNSKTVIFWGKNEVVHDFHQISESEDGSNPHTRTEYEPNCTNFDGLRLRGRREEKPSPSEKSLILRVQLVPKGSQQWQRSWSRAGKRNRTASLNPTTTAASCRGWDSEEVEKRRRAPPEREFVVGRWTFKEKYKKW